MTKRKDGTYQAQVTIQVNGKPKIKYFYGKTQRNVRKKMLAYQGEIERGMLFEEVADKWDTAHREAVTYNAHRTYSVPYKMALESFSGVPVNQITPIDVNNHIKRLAARGYSLRTVKAHIALLNMIFNYAIIQEYCNENPAALIKPPRGLKTTQRELPNEIDIPIIEQSVDKPFGLFAYLLLNMGCRRGEALALTYEDIDFQNKTITVNKSIYFEGNAPIVKSTKTKAGDRVIILLDRLADQLDKNGKGYLFHMEDGRPLTQTAFRRRWDSYIKATGITTTPHQLRHLFATVLYEADIDEATTKELMGHSSIAVTRNVYTHIRKTKIDAAASVLNAYLS